MLSYASAGTRRVPRRDPWAVILAALCALDLVLIAPRLLVPDLNLDYPFMDGDSWDWIANGLRLAGAGVRSSGRPLLLPAVIALLDRLGALPWLPILLQVLLLGTVLAFYDFAARLVPRRAAFAAALGLLLNHSLRGLSLQIMADVPASCLLFLACRSFLLAGLQGTPRRVLASGLWGAASALAQPAALLALLPAAAMRLARRRRGGRDWRSPWLLAGAAIFLGLPVLVGAVQRRLGPGSALAGRHWGLLRFHTGSLPFYLWSGLSLFGLPACLLAAAGLGLAVRRARRDEVPLFVVSLTAALLGFFLFFYDFDAERFLVYCAWPVGLLVAEALGRLPRGAPFGAAAALLVIGAALPLPAVGNDTAWLGVWPLPPIYAHAAMTESVTGSPRIDPAGISLRRFPVAALLRFSIPLRVWSAASPAGPRFDPVQVAADRSALFLFLNPADGGGRYRTLTRLGNALRKEVKFVPAAWLVPYRSRLGIERGGSIGQDYAVYRARLPALADSFLLVTPGDSPFRSVLEKPAGSAPAPLTPDLRAGLAAAAEIRRLVRGSDGYVALFPAATDDDPSRLYLPFLLDSTELYLVGRDEEREALALTAAAPLLGEARVGSTVVRRIVYLSRRAALIQ